MLNLQKGTLKAICTSDTNNPLAKAPVLQIVTLKKMDKSPGSEMDKVLANVSDSEFYVKARLSGNCSLMVSSGEISNFSLVEVKNYKVFTKNDNTYMFINEISKVESASEKIGNPESFNSNSASLTNSKPENDNSEAKKVKKTDNASINNSTVNSSTSTTNNNTNNNTKTELIASINPFSKNFNLKLSCLSKSVFDNFTSIELFDSSGRIKLSGYSESAKILKDLVKPGKTYLITAPLVKMAKRMNLPESSNKNKIFGLKMSEFEIVADKNTKIEYIGDKTEELMKGLTKLAELKETGEFNIMCCIKACYPSSEITTRAGKKMKKRDILVTDFSTINNSKKNTMVKDTTKITLWNHYADMEFEKDSLHFFSCLRPNLYNETLSLGTTYTSCVISELTGGDYDSLKKEMEQKNFSLSSTGTGQFKNCVSIFELKKDDFGQNNQDEKDLNSKSDSSRLLGHVIGTISYVRPSNVFYFACKDCRKRVHVDNVDPEEIPSLETFCDKCQKVTGSELKSLITTEVCDPTGSFYVTNFAETYEKIFDHSLINGYKLYYEEPRSFNVELARVIGKKMSFLISKRMQSYNGENSWKYTSLRVNKVNYNNLNREILEYLNQ